VAVVEEVVDVFLKDRALVDAVMALAAGDRGRGAEKADAEKLNAGGPSGRSGMEQGGVQRAPVVPEEAVGV